MNSITCSSSDGTEILSIYLGNYCFGGGSPNPVDREGNAVLHDHIEQWWDGKVNTLALRGGTNHVLLMNGCDHTAMDPYRMHHSER